MKANQTDWRLGDGRVVHITSLKATMPDLVYADQKWDWAMLTKAEWRGAKAISAEESERLTADKKPHVIPAPPWLCKRMEALAKYRPPSRKLSHSKLVNSIRKGAMYHPAQPGLLEAAREVLLPMIENLKGREILFDEHVLELARVEYVEVTDEGFHIVATRIKYIDTGRGLMFAPGHEPTGPLEIGGSWEFWYLCRPGIKVQMACTIFFPDPTLVAAVKAALERGAAPREIFALVFPPEEPRGK